MTVHNFRTEEAATILAALEHYKQSGFGDKSKRPVAVNDIATSNNRHDALTDAGINTLSDSIRLADAFVRVVFEIGDEGADITASTMPVDFVMINHEDLSGKSYEDAKNMIFDAFSDVSDSLSIPHGEAAFAEKREEILGRYSENEAIEV